MAQRDKERRHYDLRESLLLEATGVNRETGVIQGVKVLGYKSKNGREYDRAGVTKALPMYEGLAVNVNHPDKSSPNGDRNVGDRFGMLKSVREAKDGLYADLHYLKAHPLAAMVTEAAERMPGAMGLSHNASGRVVKRQGKTVVEEIESVRSVDLVADPATVASLFESENHTVSKTLREVLGGVPADHWSRKGLLPLLEMEDMGDPSMGEIPVDVPADADADGQIDAAFKAMVNGVLDDKGLDVQGKISRIKEILKAQDKLMSGGKEPEKKEPPKEETPESLRREVATLKARDEVRDLLESAGVKASAVQIEAAVALPTADKRKAFVESLKVQAPTRERPRFSAPLFESGGNGTPVFPEPKDFAKAIR